MNDNQSPWHKIPTKPPFWLPCDEPYIRYFNLTAKDSVRIKANAYPEPYFGNPEAPVVLLLLNPGGGEASVDALTPLDVQASLRNQYTAGASMTRHFHLSAESVGAGQKWWTKVCRSLLTDVDRETLQSKILSIEFSAYHSKSFGHSHLRLPSQRFSFNLVRHAIERKALVVCMRGERYWCSAVPELASYDKFRRLKNPRAASVSPRNVGEYEELLAVLRA